MTIVSIQVVAHTPAVISVEDWEQAAARPDFPEKLRARLQRMEAWAAMQARPYLDQRILGILSLLAEQFGVPHPAGTRIELRLTHCAAGFGSGRHAHHHHPRLARTARAGQTAHRRQRTRRAVHLTPARCAVPSIDIIGNKPYRKRCRNRSSPHPSPLPKGEGTERSKQISLSKTRINLPDCSLSQRERGPGSEGARRYVYFG